MLEESLLFLATRLPRADPRGLPAAARHSPQALVAAHPAREPACRGTISKIPGSSRNIVPCSVAPASRQPLRLPSQFAHATSCLCPKPPPRWRRYEMTSSTRSRGYLPHLETQEAIYFVTFRLADSLPRELVLQPRSGIPSRTLASQGIQGRAIFLVCANYAPY